MTTRAESCSWCRLQLWLPPDSQTLKCVNCQPITGQTSASKTETALEVEAHTFNSITNRSSLPGYAYRYPQAITYGYGSSAGYTVHFYGQQPPPPLPPPPPRAGPFLPSSYGRKRALLCGVSYRGKKFRIKGSINDVNCMKYLLTEKLGFPPASILVLTENEMNSMRIPTKQNIRRALRWLVEGTQSGDSLVFHFSGHGSRQPDDDMDEVDGMDETLCPLDFETEGVIVDDEINSTIVRPLPRGAILHSIIDACYSGTILDLPFLCRINRDGYYRWEDQRVSHAYKGTSGGLAISLSACEDDQICVDTTALSGNASTGALTYSFIQAIENEPGLTYGRLLNSMSQAIRGARTCGLRLNGPVASLLNKMWFKTELSQVPQLSCSEKFDIYLKKFAL